MALYHTCDGFSCRLPNILHCIRLTQPQLSWSQICLFPWPLFDLMQSGSLAHSLVSFLTKQGFLQGGWCRNELCAPSNGWHRGIHGLMRCCSGIQETMGRCSLLSLGKLQRPSCSYLPLDQQGSVWACWSLALHLDGARGEENGPEHAVISVFAWHLLWTPNTGSSKQT